MHDVAVIHELFLWNLINLLKSTSKFSGFMNNICCKQSVYEETSKNIRFIC